MGAVGDAIRREWRLIAFILTLILVFGLLWFWRSVLLPFIIGLIFAYMLLPIIRWIEKRFSNLGKKRKLRDLTRIITIIIVYLLALAIVGLLIFYIVNIISDALSTIKVDASEIIPNGLATIRDWVKSLPFLASESSQETIDQYFNQASEALPGLLIDFLSSGVRILSTSADTIIGFIIMPIFMFFLLKDWEKIRDKFYESLTPWARRHTRAVFNILQDVVIRYARGQLLLGLVVGALTYILLMVMGIDFAVPLAIFSAATELVPMIGPWIGGGLGVLVTLAIAPEKALWVALGYLVIQLLENQLLAPRIQGSQMEIHPAFVIVLGVLGAYFAGILGFIVILPATMALIRLFRYFRDSMNTGRLDRTLSDDYLPPGG